MFQTPAAQKLLDARLSEVQLAAVLNLVEEHERELAPLPVAAAGVRSLRGLVEHVRDQARAADPLRA